MKMYPVHVDGDSYITYHTNYREAVQDAVAREGHIEVSFDPCEVLCNKDDQIHKLERLLATVIEWYAGGDYIEPGTIEHPPIPDGGMEIIKGLLPENLYDAIDNMLKYKGAY